MSSLQAMEEGRGGVGIKEREVPAEWDRSYKPLPNVNKETNELQAFNSTLYNMCKTSGGADGNGSSTNAQSRGDRRKRSSMSKALRSSVTHIHVLADATAEEVYVSERLVAKHPRRVDQPVFSDAVSSHLGEAYKFPDRRRYHGSENLPVVVS